MRLSLIIFLSRISSFLIYKKNIGSNRDKISGNSENIESTKNKKCQPKQIY